MAIPGWLYSLILAGLAWAADYFTSGDGSSIPWAPIALATIPLIIKWFTDTIGGGEAPTGAARSMGGPAVSEARRLWLG